MTRFAVISLVVLTACSGGSEGPPSNAENACMIKRERPSWFRAMAATEKRWGVPVNVQLATFYQESSFRPKARTPRRYFLGFIPAGRVSTAYGYAQAIDGTWEWYQRDTGKRRAKRDRFADASDFMGWYMARTTQTAGVHPHDAYNQYLAYHEGHSGFQRGSYNRKPWLQNTAARVQSRANTYAAQLASCS
ncbi:lytic transglycosylase [Halovulum dunhuangense]|uniref:Lytic transglycosylase n=1 Tax=Halovulum dunhuangense TaxID=1505036 RepID=A0A849KXD0_9RHOB|nr:transglycosylase SLT domain-containing protein [Halovulum dunhuangense]NNU79177.1 lytic transglycosylase [Halovulum dunhuangense]